MIKFTNSEIGKCHYSHYHLAYTILKIRKIKIIRKSSQNAKRRNLKRVVTARFLKFWSYFWKAQKILN